MLKRPIIVSFFVLLFCAQITAQTDYWQQEVNIKMEVTLDDEDHFLHGHTTIEYVNNSPDDLDFIYLHLWPNAFRQKGTAYDKQRLRTGSSRFYFSEAKYAGYIDSLSFTSESKELSLEYDKKNPDIAILRLPNKLKSGEKITLKSPMRLKIPGSFSRLGHVGQSYQITQWFPKPAVYDHKGWHPMPYLNMGEYYSEFGDYEVKITLPSNYVVGASGVLQEEAEYKFLDERIALTNKAFEQPFTNISTFPASSKEWKTITFKADNVHDFGWFADKRFYVQKSNVAFGNSGRSVDTWVMFTNVEGELWKKGIEYVNRAVEFYSHNVGEYPWPQATAVQSALSAGGGMEYPMITVIGTMGSAQPLDEVITHEVGHNWFYGILGFNERDHGWLDEGINSYYDHRYTEKYYEGSSSDMFPDFIYGNSDYTLKQLAYLYQARKNEDQAPETHSDEFVPINYFLGIYEKPAVALKYLEKYLGTKPFDKIMQGFYDLWKFKHPYPEDFRSYVESQTDKDLNWFFDGLINSNDKIDYAIKSLKKEDEYKVKVKNKGEINSPVRLSGMKDDQEVQSLWYDGFEGTKTLLFPKGEYDEIVIDPGKLAPEVERRNNTIRTKGIFPKMNPLHLQFIMGIESSKKTNIYYTPAISWNNYDKTMLGVGIANATLLTSPLEFALVPMYGLSSKTITGIGYLGYNHYPDANWLDKVQVGLHARRFSFDRNFRFDYHLQYNKLKPFITFEFGGPSKSNKSHTFSIVTDLIWEEEATFSGVGEFLQVESSFIPIYNFVYSFEDGRTLNPYDFEAILQVEKYEDFIRSGTLAQLQLELNTAFTYARDKNIYARVFGGYFIDTPLRESGGLGDGQALTTQAFVDDKYDEYFFGRSEESGIFSQQISLGNGGMKWALGSPYLNIFGMSNNFVISLNLSADLPISLPWNIPLQPFLDFGYYDDLTPLGGDLTFNDQFIWQGGLMLNFSDVVSVHFPIVSSTNLRDLYRARSNNSYWSRITFMVALDKLDPFVLRDKLNF